MACATPRDRAALEPAGFAPYISAADRTELYFPQLEGKRIGVVANQTSRVGDNHLVDVLIGEGADIRMIFAPEHGFRSAADAGAKVADERDAKTGLPIYSLYGEIKKPSPAQAARIDIFLFDIQDVGVRFYTYLSTLHYVMESCAESGTPLIVLDRPNPNGFYIDGPVLDPEFSSFVGLHPVPIVYGMTLGEYAQMINGEGWLAEGRQCELKVIPLDNYDRSKVYALPVRPSPNLPNAQAVALYPSLALFEGTVVSVGRGTEFPFQLIGHPDYPEKDFTFTPRPVPGARHPKLEGQNCYGEDLRRRDEALTRDKLDLSYLIRFHADLSDHPSFFLENNFFDRPAGTDILRAQIIAGQSEAEIRKSWQDDLRQFRKIRTKYLIYDDVSGIDDSASHAQD